LNSAERNELVNDTTQLKPLGYRANQNRNKNSLTDEVLYDPPAVEMNRELLINICKFNFVIKKGYLYV